MGTKKLLQCGFFFWFLCCSSSTLGLVCTLSGGWWFDRILVSRSATVFFPGDCELGSNAGRSKATTHKNKNVVGNGLKRRRCYEAIDEEATRGSIAAQWLPARVGCCCNVFSMWFQAKTDPKLQVRIRRRR